MNAKVCLVCSVVVAGLVVCLGIERRGWSRVDQGNKDLRLQLGQMEALQADNRQLLALLTANSAEPSRSNQESYATSAIDEPVKDLLRLRGEVAALREVSRAIETLRENTRQTRAALEADEHNRNHQTQDSANGSSGSQLEILRAVYWTDNARLDVTGELRDRIRGDSLKTIASNNLKGDPEFGQGKHLTIEYRYAGVTLTNEFREGALVVLPPETP